MDGPRPHRPTIELLESFPAEAQAGATIDFTVRVSCPEGCDLSRGVLEVVGADETVQTNELSRADEEEGVLADLSVKAPRQTRAAVWAIRFPDLEAGGCVHEERSLRLTCAVLPHTTSMAIWGVPNSSEGQSLHRQRGDQVLRAVRARGSAGRDAGRRGGEAGGGAARRRAATRHGRSLRDGGHPARPDRTGVFSTSVGFSPDELDLPHVGTVGDFTFRCVEPPEHTVSVRVVHEGIDVPLGDIEVRLGPYQAMTDPEGVAGVAVAKRYIRAERVEDRYRAGEHVGRGHRGHRNRRRCGAEEDRKRGRGPDVDVTLREPERCTPPERGRGRRCVHLDRSRQRRSG